MPSQITNSGARMTRGMALSRTMTGSSRSAAHGDSAAAKPSTTPRSRPPTRPTSAATNVASRCDQNSAPVNSVRTTAATAEGGGA